MEHSILAALLKRIDGQNMGIVIGFDELRTAYTELALSRFDSVILHPSRGIRRGTVHKIEL